MTVIGTLAFGGRLRGLILRAVLSLLVACGSDDDDASSGPQSTPSEHKDAGASSSAMGGQGDAAASHERPDCTGDTEPNDSADLACSVELSTLVKAKIEEGKDDAVDCFRFDMEADATYTLSVMVTDATGFSSVAEGLELDVRSATGSVLLSTEVLDINNSGGDFVFESGGAEQGIVCLSSQMPLAFWAYQFRIDPDSEHGLTHDSVTHEPNNTVSTAYPIEVGSIVESRIEEGIADPADCFRFDTEADATYTLSVAVTDATGFSAVAPNLELEVRDEKGSVLLSTKDFDTNNREADFVFEPGSSGAAVVCLTSQLPRAFWAYELRVDPDFRHGLMQDSDTQEPNNTAPTAYPIELRAQVESRIEEGIADTTDCFRFVTTASTSYVWT